MAQYKEVGTIKYPQNLDAEKQALINMLAQNYANELKDIDDEKKRNLNKLRTGAALEIGSAFIPMGTGVRLAAPAVKAIAPYVGKKIAQEIGTGLVGGGLSGAIFGGGRGLMEDKNPLETAAYDALIGAALGGAGGAAIGKAGDEINRRVIIPTQRKMRMQNVLKEKVNPFTKAYNDVLYDNDNFIDLTNAFNDPNLNLQNSLKKAKQFINEANANEIAFETGSPDFFLDMLGNSKQRGHILRSDKVRQMEDTDKLNHNVIMSNFDEVSKGLKPISNKPTPNKKINDKPNVEDYYYFEGNVKNGDDIIPIIADAEKNFGEPLTKPQKLHLYNVYDKKFSPILNDKTSVTLGENSNNIIAKNNSNFNVLDNAYNDSIQNLNNSANINNMRKELPRYIETEVEKPEVWGTVKSTLTENNKQGQMLRDLYNFEMKGKPLSITELKNRYSNRPDEEIKKVYDIYLNKNYEITRPYQASIKTIEQKYNKDYRPLYKQSSNDDIIEFYNSQSSTDKIGHGYNNYSMSNNAVEAYKSGNMPVSKWNKNNIIKKIKDISKEFDIPINKEVLNKTSLKDLKAQYLKKNGYHHTSKMYNATDFYNIDIEKLLEQADKM